MSWTLYNFHDIYPKKNVSIFTKNLTRTYMKKTDNHVLTLNRNDITAYPYTLSTYNRTRIYRTRLYRIYISRSPNWKTIKNPLVYFGFHILDEFRGPQMFDISEAFTSIRIETKSRVVCSWSRIDSEISWIHIVRLHKYGSWVNHEHLYTVVRSYHSN